MPDILVSGNHGAVDAWRHEQALERTRRNRPDLFAEAADSEVRHGVTWAEAKPASLLYSAIDPDR